MISNASRAVLAAAAVCLITSCSGGQSSPAAPVTPVSANASRAGAFGAAARLAPFTLKDFHGAMGAYTEELQKRGYLAAAPAAKSWLNHAAFDAASGATVATRLDSTTPAAAATATPKKLLFGINLNQNTVDIYQTNLAEPSNQNQAMIGQIALPTYGVAVAVDGSANVYVSAGVSVYEYTKKSMPNPARTITLPHTAEGLAVAPDGTIYAAIFRSYEANNVGIYVVAPGATAPTSALSDPRINNALNVATDQNGDAYVVYTKAPADNTYPETVGEFPAGSTQMTEIDIPGLIPGDIQIDGSGDLVLSAARNAVQQADIDIVPSGSNTVSQTFIIENKYDYLYFDHQIDNNHLYLIENNVAESTPGSPMYEYTTKGTQIDTIGGSNTYFKLATAPFKSYSPAYVPSTASPSPSAPPASPTPVATTYACQNAIDGPILDPQNGNLTFGGGTTCVHDPNTVWATTVATLYNATTNAEISQFYFSTSSSDHAEKRTIRCPFTGSYYVTVSSDAAATVTSSTVTATRDSNGNPTC